jgi:transposase
MDLCRFIFDHGGSIMKAYSVDLRSRVLAACANGMGTEEASETFVVSGSWVRRIRQRERENGETAPRIQTNRGPAPILNDRAEQIRRLLADNPGMTAGECRDRLGLTVAVVTVWRMICRLGLTFKKSR